MDAHKPSYMSTGSSLIFSGAVVGGFSTFFYFIIIQMAFQFFYFIIIQMVFMISVTKVFSASVSEGVMASGNKMIK